MAGTDAFGSEYAGFLADFPLSGYTIRHMEVIAAGESEVTLHYVVQTQAERADAQDLAGLFHVVSIWKKKEKTWNLLFNMDARIFEA